MLFDLALDRLLYTGVCVSVFVCQGDFSAHEFIFSNILLYILHFECCLIVLCINYD